MAVLPDDLVRRIEALTAARTPFVHATVVRAERPCPTHPGDAALIHTDGEIEGFVGGMCAESSVRVAAQEVLATGEPLLLRIVPGDGAVFPETPGAVTVENPCLSGGSIEIFLTPHLPPARLAVIGETPIAEAVARMAASVGFDVDRDPAGAGAGDVVAVVVACHGRPCRDRSEESLLLDALTAGVGFVGLVASPRRGSAVVASLALGAEDRARVRTPVGLDIGARTPEEIALSIVAEVVRAVRVEGMASPSTQSTPAMATAGSAEPVVAVDPICGMTVVAAPPTLSFTVDDETFWFCNPGCRDRFAAERGCHVGASGR